MKPKKHAWLITWQWFSERDRREPKVVAVLDSRFSEDRVKSMLHAIFLGLEPLTLGEKLYHGQPIPKIKQLLHPSDHGIRFGYKPELFARIVDDVWVEQHPDATETLHWTETPTVKGQTQRVSRQWPEQH